MDKTKAEKPSSNIARNRGSFRDPSGYVFQNQERVFRTITEVGLANYQYAKNSGFLDAAISKKYVVDCQEVDKALVGEQARGACLVVEHPKLPFISYPYEWSFEALKTAALLHLDLHLMALDYSVTLTDASAYNVQFVGSTPVFIDVLSFREYRTGEFWTPHRQFCEQFLNPLILRSHLGVAHNSFYRGNLEGISVSDIERILPNWRKFSSWTLFSQVYLQAKLQASANKDQKEIAREAVRKQFPKTAFVTMLKQLRNWISKLQPNDKGKTVWSDYAHNHSYRDDETSAKRAFIAEFASKVQPKTVWDLGCNTGDYSKVCLDAGAEICIGFDFDQDSLDAGFERARQKNLNFLPLYLDAANPSPGQGWKHCERMSLAERANADAVLALAFEHHLAIGRNVPFGQVINWIVSLAPCGVVEFVPKSDPMIVRMLSLREDIFPEYTEENFRSALEENARTVKSQQVSQAGRMLYWYDKS